MRRILLLASVVAAIVAAPAWASHYDSYWYWDGYLAPQQGDSTGYDACDARFYNLAESGAGLYTTTAFINRSGGWVRSNRTSSGRNEIVISESEAWSYDKKSHCKNSDPLYTFYVSCATAYYITHLQCV